MNNQKRKLKMKDLVSKEEFLELVSRLDQDVYNAWVNDQKISEEEYDRLSGRVDAIRESVIKITSKYNMIIITLILTNVVEIISKVLSFFGIGGNV